MAGTGSSRDSAHGHLEIKSFSGSHLTAEPRSVNSTKKRDATAKAFVGEHRGCPELGE